MGIESVVYRFEPQESETIGLVNYLRLRGATDGDREGTYVLSTADCWIDLRLDSEGPQARALMMRVAVTNQTAVVPVLEELMTGLVARWGGRITDATGNRVIQDADRLSTLTAEYQTARDRFTGPLGDVTLPVSADEVFARLRSGFDEDAP